MSTVTLHTTNSLSPLTCWSISFVYLKWCWAVYNTEMVCLSDFGVCFLFVRILNVFLWKNTATKFKLKVISTREMLLENPEVDIPTSKFSKSVFSFVLNHIVNIVDLISCEHDIISHFVRIRTSFVEVPLCDRKSTKPHRDANRTLTSSYTLACQREHDVPVFVCWMSESNCSVLSTVVVPLQICIIIITKPFHAGHKIKKEWNE